MDANEILRHAIEHLVAEPEGAWRFGEHWSAAGFLWQFVEPRPVVLTVLGDSREATRFAANGDYFCPFCSNPIWRSKGKHTCENPWCDAFPGWEPEKLKEHRAKREAREAEDARRKRDHEWSEQRRREDAARHEEWQQEQIAEAKRRGTCLACLFQPGWERVKFVKHRGICPKERENG